MLLNWNAKEGTPGQFALSDETLRLLDRTPYASEFAPTT
jgi:hypothetical protein